MTSRPRLAARLASRLLFLGGAVTMAGAMYTYASAHAFQTRELARFTASRAMPPSTPVLIEPPRQVLAEGEAFGEIRIDRLHVDAVIAEGDSAAVLRRAVGHLTDTPHPGEAGNVVLAAHRDTFFRPLKEIRPGDVIEILDTEHRWQYRVQWSRVG